MTNIELFCDDEGHVRPNYTQEHFEKYKGPEVHTGKNYQNNAEGNEGNPKSNLNNHSTKVKRRIRQKALSEMVKAWGFLA